MLGDFANQVNPNYDRMSQQAFEHCVQLRYLMDIHRDYLAEGVEKLRPEPVELSTPEQEEIKASFSRYIEPLEPWDNGIHREKNDQAE